MSRDSKNKRSSPVRKSARGGTVLGIFIGLIIGILIALAVVWYMNRTPAPFLNKPQQGEPISAPAKNGSANAGPAPLPGKPGDPPQEKRFQFYDILPGKSEPKPDAKPADKNAPAAAKATGPTALQVGSYQNQKDAENQRATLTLSGFEPVVQEVKIADKTWYRVRLGPYNSFEEMNKVRTNLAKNGVQAVVVKPNE
jgi:cell division protein FtsN